MPRPAIVIGLGGTGQQVVTFLKKELMEIGGGQMPPEVKLLAFDTASRVAPQGGKDNVYRLGNVALEEGTEYTCIGADLYPLAEEIRQGRHPHLQWFPAETYHKKNLPRAAYNTTQGAGAVRQMGRLSLFKSVSFVLAHLQKAITGLQIQVTGQLGTQDLRLLEILIVGSFAGGTGAGTLVDLAWLARLQADSILKQKYVLRGFFVLPSAFTTGAAGEARDKMARSFAAWGELDRSMISKGSGNVIIYNPHDQNLWVNCDKPAYDVTYLIDPQRPNLPLLPPPEEGVFPAIANIMSLILDDKAGVVYTEHLINTIASTRALLPRGVYHSSIGAYTLKVPVYYAQAKFSHQLAIDVLKEFLAPEFNDKGRVVHLSPLHNQQGQGKTALQAAVGFLSSDALNVGGKNIPNSKLLQLIGGIRARNALDDGKVISHVAESGLTAGLLGYFNALNQITEWDEEKHQVKTNDRTDELNWAIYKVCPPSRAVGDTPEEAWPRLTATAMTTAIPAVRRTRYGEATVAGPDKRLRGTFGNELEESKRAQLTRFKELLQARTLLDLNGDHPDARIARGGRIGYALAFYQELAEVCGYFIAFLNKVRAKRGEELKVAQTTRNAADRAMKNYDLEKSKRCWLTFWDDFTHPEAHIAQRNYLEAEQRDIDVRRGDILLDVLAETVGEMKAYVEKTRDEIVNWIAHVALGDPAFNITGLYPLVEDSLHNVEINHDLDKRLGNPDFATQKSLRKVSQIIAEHTYRSDNTMIADAIGKISWQVEQAADCLRLSCGIEFPGDTPDAASTFEALRRDGEKPEQHNLNLLLKLSERPFQGLKQDHPLAREIVQAYPTGQQLATALQGHPEPFYMPAAVPAPPAVRKAYVRVEYEVNANTVNYFQMGFVPQFQQLNPQLGTQGLQLVSSQDRYKFTLVRSDDLMASKNFAQWDACQQRYLQHIHDPNFGGPAEELYVFPAEVNAAHFETKMPAFLAQNRPKLQPEAVSLLEDRDRFALFFLAVAHGYVQTEAAPNGAKFWRYKLPSQHESLYLTLPPTGGLQLVSLDIFDVIRAFLSGHDQRANQVEVTKIVWDELLQAIFKREAELGRSESIAAYFQQMGDEDARLLRPMLPQPLLEQVTKARQQARQNESMVNIILAQVNAVTSEGNPTLAEIQRQNYHDLADLARVVYLEAIQRCNTVLQDKPKAAPETSKAERGTQKR